MDSTSFSAVVDFEVYLLMTMKPRLSLSDTSGLLDSKLAMVGLSMDGAKRIRDRIAGALSVESSRFRDMKTLLGVGDEGAATFLKYSSVLWPGFEFRAQAGIDECLESAGYVHVQRSSRCRITDPVACMERRHRRIRQAVRTYCLPRWKTVVR